MESLDEKLRRYAVDLNAASAANDKWLTALYCTPFSRKASPCANFDPSFDAYAEHLKIKQLVSKVGNAGTESLASEIASRINKR